MRARESTRQLIIEHAERLFADSGIEAVSLRQIAAAAGQRNPGVVQYHFGSKEGVVRAIYEHRLDPINTRRLAMLAGLQEAGRLDDPRSVVEAFVVPLLAELRSERRYLEFTARLLQYEPEMTYADVDPRLLVSARRTVALMDGHMSHLPAPLRQARIDVLISAVFNSLAERQRDVHRFEAARALTTETFGANLVDAATGILLAPAGDLAREQFVTGRHAGAGH